MIGTENVAPSEQFSAALRRPWGWLLALGVVQVIGGIVAIAVPHVGALVAVALFAALLILSAIFHVIHAFKVRKWSGFVLHLLGGLLYGGAGVLIVIYPVEGVAALMLVFGILFIADGAIKIILAAGLRPRDGWVWFLAGGIAGIILGALLLVTWPVAAMWIVGLLFGINLVVSGLMNGIIAWMCRKGKSASVSPGEPAAA